MKDKCILVYAAEQLFCSTPDETTSSIAYEHIPLVGLIPILFINALKHYRHVFFNLVKMKIILLCTHSAQKRTLVKSSQKPSAKRRVSVYKWVLDFPVVPWTNPSDPHFMSLCWACSLLGSFHHLLELCLTNFDSMM